MIRHLEAVMSRGIGRRQKLMLAAVRSLEKEHEALGDEPGEYYV